MGVITLFNNTFKRRLPGQNEEKSELKTEDERIKVLQEEFGIGNLPDNCREIIKSKGLSLP
jgi:arylamine N-acetyltransferase